MRIAATAKQMKELDRIAIEERGISSMELMEHAAQAVVQTVSWVLKDYGRDIIGGARSLLVVNKYGLTPTPEEQAEIDQMRAIVEKPALKQRIGIFCGPGNNGGDGIAAARLLMDLGYEVRTFLVGDRDKMTPDAKAMEEKLLEAGGTLEPYAPSDQMTNVWLSTCSVMVDALFGIGLSRPVTGDFLTAIARMNHVSCPVVSCDIPSGLHADTGEILGDAVRAAATVTFTFPKPGLYLNEGRACTGQVDVADIGIPFDLSHKLVRRQPGTLHILDHGQYVLPRRPRTAHKGDFGKVFILAGSEGYTGAPVFAARAAVRSGAGLVFLGVPSSIYPITAVKCDEAMPFPLPQKYDMILEKAQHCDVAVIGPGLGRSANIGTLVRFLLSDLDIPVVLDADGINALEGHIDILDRRSALTVLTPHDGEFQRLTGCSLPITDRLSAARDFAQTHHCVLVLKGHCTITAAPDGRAFLNATGNPGMAKGGSGDVLAGMISALLGQTQLHGPHFDPAELTAIAVYYHGEAGDECARRFGEYSMTPSDMLTVLPCILKKHTQRPES